MSTEISNSDYTIEADALRRAIAELADSIKADPTDLSSAKELQILVNLMDDADRSSGDRNQFVLIADARFVDYAREYASDLGPTEGWPYDHIDWDKAADALKQDYKQVDYDGETYWVRA